MKIARFFTGRHKMIARYRSYHGATAGAICLTGDPRRWAVEPGIPGVIHVLDPYHGIERGWESAETSLAMIEETIQLEGPHTIAAFILEPVVGTNGIPIPPEGYLQGLRKLCDKYGILMIADEVMAGFGRTGEWFAVDHWKVVPDLLCMAKGLTSSYLPLGAVGMRHHIAQHFQDKVFYGGLTYNSHPMGCAAALATIGVYEEDGLIGNAKKMGVVMKQLGAEVQAKHPSVGAVRSIGLFGIFELIRSRKTRQPLAPFNGTSDEMAALGRFFREQGLYTFVRWNTFFTNPPLCINEQQFGKPSPSSTAVSRSRIKLWRISSRLTAHHCHPERSEPLAKPIARAVEGPHVCQKRPRHRKELLPSHWRTSRKLEEKDSMPGIRARPR